MDKRRTAAAFFLLAAALLILLALNLNLGSICLSPGEVWRVLTGQSTDLSAAGIVRTIRLPRLIAAAVLGGALAVSGFLLQTFFGNPIAGPFVLGISTGAKLTVALSMILSLSGGFLLSSAGMILSAFLGAMASMGLILLISGRAKSMAVLVICGIMIGYICSAVTDFAVTFADDSNIVNLHNWSRGSFSGMSWESVRVLVPVTAVCLILTFLLSKPMGAYQLGEVYARNMGVDLRRFRSRQPLKMIPACFLGGAAFCLLCDLLARTVFAPSELSISTVTAVFGAPVVIWVMLSRRKERA